MKKHPKLKALLFMKGESERVPRKNMKPFCGRPLFHWIMETLSKIEFIDDILINTDSAEIADSARKHFKVTIHERPTYLLDIKDNEANQILQYDLSVTDGDHFLQTHCTNPLLKSETIDLAVKTYFHHLHQYDSLFSVTSVQKRFYWPDGKPVNHQPEKLIKTQELPPLLEENSCIYIFSREVFDDCHNRIGQNPLLFPTDPHESIDIDEPIDFTIAEAMMAEQIKLQAN